MWCFHKFGEIKQRYQYCQKCGKANLVGCFHKWVFETTYEYSNIHTKNMYKSRRLYKCEICGETKIVDID